MKLLQSIGTYNYALEFIYMHFENLPAFQNIHFLVSTDDHILQPE